MGLEPTATEFRSEALTDKVIKPWVQLALKANNTVTLIPSLIQIQIYKIYIYINYHIYQFIPLHSYDYLKKISIKETWRLTKATAEMKDDSEETMKLE